MVIALGVECRLMTEPVFEFNAKALHDTANRVSAYKALNIFRHL